jgi:hypothetical protein
MSKFIGARDLEELTGLTDVRHRQISRLGFFKPPVKGKYLHPESVRGIFRYYQERTQATHDEVAEEKRRKLSAEREIKEQQAAKLAGSLVSVLEVSRVWVRCVTAARTILKSTRGKLALQLGGLTGIDPTDIEEKLQERDKHLLCELHGGKWVDPEELQAPKSQKKAKPKRKRAKRVSTTSKRK